jgi:hypothetical protein
MLEINWAQWELELDIVEAYEAEELEEVTA